MTERNLACVLTTERLEEGVGVEVLLFVHITISGDKTIMNAVWLHYSLNREEFRTLLARMAAGEETNTTVEGLFQSLLGVPSISDRRTALVADLAAEAIISLSLPLETIEKLTPHPLQRLILDRVVHRSQLWASTKSRWVLREALRNQRVLSDDPEQVQAAESMMKEINREDEGMITDLAMWLFSAQSFARARSLLSRLEPTPHIESMLRACQPSDGPIGRAEMARRESKTDEFVQAMMQPGMKSYRAWIGSHREWSGVASACALVAGDSDPFDLAVVRHSQRACDLVAPSVCPPSPCASDNAASEDLRHKVRSLAEKDGILDFQVQLDLQVDPLSPSVVDVPTLPRLSQLNPAVFPAPGDWHQWIRHESPKQLTSSDWAVAGAAARDTDSTIQVLVRKGDALKSAGLDDEAAEWLLAASYLQEQTGSTLVWSALESVMRKKRKVQDDAGRLIGLVISLVNDTHFFWRSPLVTSAQAQSCIVTALALSVSLALSGSTTPGAMWRAVLIHLPPDQLFLTKAVRLTVLIVRVVQAVNTTDDTLIDSLEGLMADMVRHLLANREQGSMSMFKQIVEAMHDPAPLISLFCVLLGCSANHRLHGQAPPPTSPEITSPFVGLSAWSRVSAQLCLLGRSLFSSPTHSLSQAAAVAAEAAVMAADDAPDGLHCLSAGGVAASKVEQATGDAAVWRMAHAILLDMKEVVLMRLCVLCSDDCRVPLALADTFAEKRMHRAAIQWYLSAGFLGPEPPYFCTVPSSDHMFDDQAVVFRIVNTLTSLGLPTQAAAVWQMSGDLNGPLALLSKTPVGSLDSSFYPFFWKIPLLACVAEVHTAHGPQESARIALSILEDPSRNQHTVSAIQKQRNLVIRRLLLKRLARDFLNVI